MGWLGLCLALTLVSGCSRNGDGGNVGGELVIAAPADGYRTEVGSDVGLYPVNANVYEPLLRLSPDYRVEPMLATRWELRPPNSWRFHLRQGVRMHDGTIFTARAVVWTMRRIASADPTLLGLSDSSARVIDDSTVDITPIRPNLRLPEQLVHPNWSIMMPGTRGDSMPVGTGPFSLVEYVKGDHITVERFANYWGERAKTRRLTFRFVPDPNTRVLALRAGDAHVAFDLPRESSRYVSGTSGLTVARSPVGSYEALYVNTHGTPPYDLGRDRAIRRAVASAIDRTAIVENVWQGNAELTQTFVPPSILGASARVVRGVPFDAARARQVLDSAGWTPGGDGIRVKQGRRLTLTMIVGFPNPEIHRPMPEIVQAQLRLVGMDLQILQLPDNASYQARVRSGEGDLWAEAGGQNDGNPCFLLELLFYGRRGYPLSGYSRLFAPGPRFDDEVEACRSAADPSEVQREAADAVGVLVDEELVVIPLAATYRLWGLNDRVRGFEPHPSSLSQRWEGVWLAR